MTHMPRQLLHITNTFDSTPLWVFALLTWVWVLVSCIAALCQRPSESSGVGNHQTAVLHGDLIAVDL